MSQRLLTFEEQEQAAKLSQFLNTKVTEFMGGDDKRDARIIAVAAAGLAGCCIFCIEDAKLRSAIADSYVDTFRLFADEPAKINKANG